ncbi:hypothetical protein BN1356_00924 [Streptococcus varani]|uniref:HK97 gp10 family phage protein n=1 Tax=Streptococcus varani TaxID=1608583 RepID=A0A0E4H4W7_9STRE|nr:hypothetical protein [Streptococcus varani]CQR24580.1 hypothetical protein BN1356_00924 [Streptococcus varani]
MASGVKITGIDELLAKMERELGEDKVTRVVNKALRETGKELLPDFKEELSSFRDTGETVESAIISGVSRASGVPTIKLGFGEGTRWRLAHLNELGYAKNPYPNGFGVIRRFAENLEGKYPTMIANRVKGGFRIGK